MKRNMDLVRDLLLTIEDDDKRRLEQYPYDLQARHFLIVRDAGLAMGAVSGDDSNPGRYMPFRLTWQGHEFLQLMREDSLWKRAKETIMKEGVSWTFEILKAWAVAQLTD